MSRRLLTLLLALAVGSALADGTVPSPGPRPHVIAPPRAVVLLEARPA